MQRAADGGTPTSGMVRTITLLAGLAALVIATAVPAAWYVAAQAGVRGKIDGQARVYAFQVEQEARQNPAFWNALAGSLTDGADHLEMALPLEPSERIDGERKRVLSVTGHSLIPVAREAGVTSLRWTSRLDAS
jgi:hypothetical protein